MTKNFREQVAVGDGKTQECAHQLVRDNVVDKLPAIVASSDAYPQDGVNFALASSRHSQATEDDNRQVVRQTKSFQLATTTANEVHVGLLDGREREEEQEHGQDKPVQKEKRESMGNILGVKSSWDATRKQNTLRSESLAFSRTVREVQGSTATNYKLKHLKSVQLPFVSDKVNGFSGESRNAKKINDFVNPERSHNREKAKEIDNPDHPDNNATGNAATKESKPSNGFSGESQNTDKAKDFDNLEQSWNTEKAKEIDNLDHAHNNAIVNAATEENKPSNGFSDSKFEWKSRIEMLEEELREAAVVESALYSVVAEHGSSTNKVHAPARRLSRFYLHACKAESDAKRASAARAAVSGLILVSKSCGSDVPRY